MIIVSRIIHVKVDRRLNVTNKFKYQRRLSSRLAIVMFRGTPCSSMAGRTFVNLVPMTGRTFVNLVLMTGRTFINLVLWQAEPL